ARRLKNNPQKNIIISLLIILLLAWEFSFVPVKDHAPVSATPKVYAWVKNQPNENIYIIMPFGFNYLKNHWDAIYEYWSIVHFKKIVNGYSGYGPVKLEELNKILHDPNLNQKQLAAIKQSGATHIIFHFDFYPPGFDQRVAALLSDEQFAKLVYRLDNDYIYQIK
ncbi:MAG TPA: hypothetical protein P5267_03505, partial [Patescibacteria group bacterium]|nr:hypothetical protein [Patescibacteria group bacterium]